MFPSWLISGAELRALIASCSVYKHQANVFTPKWQHTSASLSPWPGVALNHPLRGLRTKKQQDFGERCSGSSVLSILGEAKISLLDPAGQGSWRNGQWDSSRVNTSLTLEPVWFPRMVLRVQIQPRTAFGHCCANLQ